MSIEATGPVTEVLSGTYVVPCGTTSTTLKPSCGVSEMFSTSSVYVITSPGMAPSGGTSEVLVICRLGSNIGKVEVPVIEMPTLLS